MSIKKIVKNILGEQWYNSAVMQKKRILTTYDALLKKKGLVTFCDNREYKLLSLKNQHVFFGYYDLEPYDSSRKRLLAHVVDRYANPLRDKAKIIYFDDNGCINNIAETQAWCWQQGARLRWNPKSDDEVLYNDVAEGRYVLKCANIKNKNSRVISDAVYDISNDAKAGITLNFSRLQRLRPGYGYSIIPDNTSFEKAPEQDGVFHVDLTTGEKTLLYSLSELAEGINGDYFHYINHISISPDGRNFIFFHLWTKGPGKPWFTRLFVSDINGEELKLLDEKHVVSHYCWKNNSEMIITTSEGFYYWLNVEDASMGRITSNWLSVDGHPSVVCNSILTDTYPQKDRTQKIYITGTNGSNGKQVLSVYSEPTLFGEKRCDLHPRVTDNHIVTIDSTVRNGVRSILTFEFRREDLENGNS